MALSSTKERWQNPRRRRHQRSRRERCSTFEAWVDANADDQALNEMVFAIDADMDSFVKAEIGFETCQPKDGIIKFMPGVNDRIDTSEPCLEEHRPIDVPPESVRCVQIDGYALVTYDPTVAEFESVENRIHDAINKIACEGKIGTDVLVRAYLVGSDPTVGCGAVATEEPPFEPLGEEPSSPPVQANSAETVERVVVQSQTPTWAYASAAVGLLSLLGLGVAVFKRRSRKEEVDESSGIGMDGMEGIPMEGSI